MSIHTSSRLCARSRHDSVHNGEYLHLNARETRRWKPCVAAFGMNSEFGKREDIGSHETKHL